MVVVAIDELGEDSVELASGEDQHPVKTFLPDRADESFGEGIGPRCPDRCADDLDPFRTEDLVEPGYELGVMVPHQEPDWPGSLSEDHGQVAGLLDDPRSRRIGGGPSHIDPSGVELDEEE